jgi:hypothetical protein
MEARSASGTGAAVDGDPEGLRAMELPAIHRPPPTYLPTGVAIGQAT